VAIGIPGIGDRCRPRSDEFGGSPVRRAASTIIDQPQIDRDLTHGIELYGPKVIPPVRLPGYASGR